MRSTISAGFSQRLESTTRSKGLFEAERIRDKLSEYEDVGGTRAFVRELLHDHNSLQSFCKAFVSGKYEKR